MHSLLKFLDLTRSNTGFFMMVECRFCRMRSQQSRQTRNRACRCHEGLVQIQVDSLDSVLSHRLQEWARQAASTPTDKGYAVEEQSVTGWLYLLPNAPALSTRLSFFIENGYSDHPRPARLARVPAHLVESSTAQFFEISGSYTSILAAKVGPAAQEQPGMSVFGTARHPCIEFDHSTQVVSLDLEPLQQAFSVSHRKAV